MLIVLVAAGVLALAVWGFEPLYIFTRGWALLLPFLIGCVTTQTFHAAVARRAGLMLIAAVLGGVAWAWIGLGTDATPPTNDGDGRSLESVALGVVGCVSGTVAILAAGALLARSPVAPALCALRQRSLEIFLAHIVVTAGTRVALVQINVTDTWWHLLAGTVLGLVVPLALAVTAERLRWSWLFGVPTRAEG